jgi:hypothetical protein
MTFRGNISSPYCRANYLLYAGFMLGAFFGPEDKGNIFLRNVDRFSIDYKAL